MTRPLLSVIVPTYGRWQHIGPLLESVVSQDFDNWECVITEDGSPDQDNVRQVVAGYAERGDDRIRFYANPTTLGYDGNLRRLIELARGEFVFIMGDDDFVAPGAFQAVAGAIARYPNLGVILRAFAFFEGTLDHVTYVTRYYAGERVFPAGPESIVACYRRAVCMSGLVLRRDDAQRVATDRWDGMLFYQHWLLANILTERDAVYLPDILAYFRKNSQSVFGTAEKERGLYEVGAHPANTAVRWNASMLTIARAVEAERGVQISALIERDFANYAYHTLVTHAHLPRREFRDFYKALGALGLSRHASYHAWYWAIRICGAQNLERAFRGIRRLMGHTPNLSVFVRSAGRRVGR